MSEYRKSLFYCVTFCVLIGVIAVYDLRLSLLQEEEKVRARVSNTSFLIGEWIKGAFTASDYILRDMVYSVPVSALEFPATDADEHARISAYIVDKQQTVPNSIGVGLSNKDCIVTHTPSIVGFDANNREWCSAMMSNPEIQTYVSNMFLSNTNELMVIQGRAFPGEGYSGQAGIGINLHFFSKWLEQVTIGPNGVVAISDQNISLLARKPAKPEALGKKVSDPIVEDFVASGQTYRALRETSALDGEGRLYGVRKVEGLPFVVLVGEADLDWQADWVGRVWATVLAVGILWIMALFTLRYYWDRLRNVAELESARDALKELSLTDALTGLANRRRFDDVLDAECRRLRRNNACISVMMIDVDCFKAFNDTYGHQEGDECLRAVGEVIRKAIKRPQDLAARYGGEEFSCILPETDRNAAVAIANTIKEGISAMEMVHESSTVADHVTASLGVATLICNEDFAPEDVVKAADEQLYWAKGNGRNRVGHEGARANK